MRAKLLPTDILLARLAVHEYRAWSRCWSESLAHMFEGRDESSALKWFSDLTGSNENEVRESRRRSRSPEEFLDSMVQRWCRARGEGNSYRTWNLPGGVLGVEPPANVDVVRQYAIEWKARQVALRDIVTADLLTLSQLQVAVAHATGDEPVLIMGETGTGKGALARAIHAISHRKGFEAINCTAIPATLIESELFGHAKGAFTGADRARPGLVEVTGDGTLFLDEVGDLAAEAQPKLLRLLREREYRRVGDHEVRSTSARFIAATNAELEQKVAKDKYREDLFQRLGACRIVLPPLRERKGDIDLLVAYRLEKDGHTAGVSEAARALLRRYEWPGNVAELSDAIRYAVTAAPDRRIDVIDLPDDIVEDTYPPRGTAAQVLLATHAATEIAGDGADLPVVLSSILDDELASPPVIGGDEEVDALVHAIMGMAAMVSKDAREKGPKGVTDAVAQVRTAALLAELRHTASEAGYPPAVVADVDARLAHLLEEIKGVPLLGMVTEVITNVFGSDDPGDRSKLREFALKIKRSGPLIARAVLPAVQNAMSHQVTVPVNGASVLKLQAHVSPAGQYGKASGTDWKNASNRPVIEGALRDVGGVKARAAKLLGIGQPYLQTLVKLHGLSEFATELRSHSRAGRAHTPQKGQ